MFTQQVKSSLITSGILTVVVVIIVLMSVPKKQNPNNPYEQPKINLFRTFVLSFLGCFTVVYLTTDNDTNNMMTNIIQGEPDF